MRYPLRDLQTLIQGFGQVFEADSPGACILPAILGRQKMRLGRDDDKWLYQPKHVAETKDRAALFCFVRVVLGPGSHMHIF